MDESKKFNYDILFIGGVYEKDKEGYYLNKSKNGIQNAVNIHQWNFIEGIDANNETPVSILSARYVSSYPHYKDIYIKRNQWNHTNGAHDENIGFFNVKVIKNIERNLKLEYKARKWAKKNNDQKEKIIICYYPSIPQMNATIAAKKLNSNIKIILIIPDIPKYMNLKKNNGDSKIKTIIDKKANKMLEKFDMYVLLTKYMKDVLNIDGKKHIVIEGIAKDTLANDEIQVKIQDEKKRIVYSGSLHEKYGMKNYLEAIKQIKDEKIEFYIFGSGEMEEEIKELSKIDKRVIFMGYKDIDTVKKYQKMADLLINPRPVSEEYTKYSFPSKLIEYMVSGTPVLTTKLISIPEEYYKYIYSIDDDSINGIKKAIEKTLKIEPKELQKKGKESQEFIRNNKNAKKQAYKMLETISAQ